MDTTDVIIALLDITLITNAGKILALADFSEAGDAVIEVGVEAGILRVREVEGLVPTGSQPAK